MSELRAPLKVALLGHGFLGKWHAEKLRTHQGVELVAIVDPSLASYPEIKAKYPDVKVVENLSSVLPEIDAAIVATPTSTHFSLVEELLNSQKHVFCEKPLCSTLKEAQSLEKVLGASRALLQVGHSERFHEAWELIADTPRYAELISKGENLKISRMGAFKGRATDVDVVQDIMVHDLDLAVFLWKETPTSVQALGYKIRTGKWDYVEATLSFASGRKAILTSSRNHTGEVRELECTGPLGTIQVDLLNLKLTLAPRGTVPEGTPGRVSEFVESIVYAKRDHLMVEQKLFFDSILHNKPVAVTGSDGLLAVRLVNAVLSSLEEKRSVQI